MRLIFGCVGFAASALVLSACTSVSPNKPGPGDHHVFIPGIEAQTPEKITADGALSRLKDGNARFAKGQGGGAGADASRNLQRVKTTGTEGQKPFAAVLTCADSRTAPELYFDQGFGDLFVVRVAGNVTDTFGLGSLEYGVDHLGIPLIVVVGHTKCGAVDAALKTVKVDANEPHHDPDHFAGNLPALVNAIIPAVKASPEPGLNAAIRSNVRQSMRQMRERSPVLARELNAGDIKVVGAIYNVDDGTIEWVE